MSNFKENSFLPIDRDYTSKFPITLGAGSYVGEATFSFRNGEEDKHILVGRFCSLAGGLFFFLGNNHHYKNSVTAYPFDMNFVVERMRLAANLPHSGYNPEQIKNIQNSHQIIIGNDVWVGEGVKFLNGVKIGSGAIIGAYSNVAKDIPPYAIAVGSPARVVKYRFDAETIKKFMAIKWWDWSIDKIYANLPLMYDVEKFLATHYNSENNRIVYEKITGGGKQIEEYLAEDYKVYSFIADFEAPRPLWKKVIYDFCSSDLANVVLIIFAKENLITANITELQAIMTSANQTGINKNIRIVTMNESRAFSPYLLRNSTHFITTREIVTLSALDFLYNTDVKIISALDDKIFY